MNATFLMDMRRRGMWPQQPTNCCTTAARHTAWWRYWQKGNSGYAGARPTSHSCHVRPGGVLGTRGAPRLRHGDGSVGSDAAVPERCGPAWRLRRSSIAKVEGSGVLLIYYYPARRVAASVGRSCVTNTTLSLAIRNFPFVVLQVPPFGSVAAIPESLESSSPSRRWRGWHLVRCPQGLILISERVDPRPPALVVRLSSSVLGLKVR